MSTTEFLTKERDYAPFRVPQIDTFIEVAPERSDEKSLAAQTRFEQYLGWQGLYGLRSNLVNGLWAARNLVDKYSKRAFDLVVSLLLLPFLLPIIGVVAIAIKLDSEGPVFFRQKRIGKHCKPFYCYKFRSMYKDAEQRKAQLMHLNEANGIVFKIKNDPRVTRVGRFIRKTSIDELPQIFNVLKGDMSLVGPRPPVPVEVQEYKFEYMRRLGAVPGITGLQQATQRTGLEYQRWVELDVQYIQEASVRRDVEIILKTIPSVITGRGAY